LETKNDYKQTTIFLETLILILITATERLTTGASKNDRDNFPIFASFYRQNNTGHRKASTAFIATIQPAERVRTVTDRITVVTDNTDTKHNVKQSFSIMCIPVFVCLKISVEPEVLATVVKKSTAL
jgi:hypothetical protein